MKYLLTVLALSFLLPLSTAYGQADFDTLRSWTVAPGVIYTKLADRTVPWEVEVLQIDLSNGYNTLRSVASNDRYGTFERTSSMALRYEEEGRQAVAAINGDFFNTSNGRPVNLQVVDGEMINNPTNNRVIAFDDMMTPFISVLSYNGRLSLGEDTVSVNGHNSDRGENQLIVYNHFFGSNTGTNDFGTEVSAVPVTQWYANADVKLVVQDVWAASGNNPIPAGGLVLSGHGNAAPFLQNAQPGDTLTINNGLIPAMDNITQVMGGNIHVVRDGINRGNPNTVREPRTAIGFSEDRNTLYFVVMDGRQPARSVGMNMYEVGEMMLYVGSYEALNTDGGGSSTFVVRHEITNIPSDGPGNERGIANALVLQSTAPRGPAERMYIEPQSPVVFLGNSVPLKVYVWDAIDNMTFASNTAVEFSLTDGLGTVTEQGVFTAGNEETTGYLYATYDGVTDSVLVTVEGIQAIKLLPDAGVTRPGRNFQFSLKGYDSFGTERPLDASKISLLVDDESVGTISSTGLFSPNSSGATDVVFMYNGLEDTSEMRVEDAEGRVRIVEFNEEVTFAFTSNQLDLATTSAVVSADYAETDDLAMRLNYAFTHTSGINSVIIDIDGFGPVFGVPDSVYVDVKTDSLRHRVSLRFRDAFGTVYSTQFDPLASSDSIYVTRGMSLGNMRTSNPFATLTYPLTFIGFELRLGASLTSGIRYEGFMDFENISGQYPVTTSMDDESYLPTQTELYQNYPNPFNPSTVIQFSMPEAGMVSVTVYDLLGRVVAQPLNEQRSAGTHTLNFDASHLSSGMYIYRLETGRQQISRKMMLIK
jgi:exopolysaccharide biosynthesis protein